MFLSKKVTCFASRLLSLQISKYRIGQSALRSKVRIRSFYGLCFPAYGLNMDRCSVFSPNAGKYGSEKLRTHTLLTQWCSGLQAYNVFKKSLQCRCFPLNFAKILRTFFTEHLRWLFLNHKICFVCAGKLVVMFYLGNFPKLLNVEEEMNSFVFNKLAFVHI